MSPRTLIHVALPHAGAKALQRRLFGPDRHVAVYGASSGTAAGKRVAHLIGRQDSTHYQQGHVDELVATVRERRPEATVHVFTDHVVSAPFGGDRGLAARRLQQTFPDAQVLLVIREQGAYWQEEQRHRVGRYGAAHLDGRTLTQVLRDDHDERAGKRLAMLDYNLIAERYGRLFGRDHVHLRAYEDLQADPGAFLAGVAGLIGRPAPAATDQPPGAKPTASRGLRDVARAGRDLGRRAADAALGRRAPTADVMLDETRAWLRDRYRDGNTWLANEYDVDLAALGYSTND